MYLSSFWEGGFASVVVVVVVVGPGGESVVDILSFDGVVWSWFMFCVALLMLLHVALAWISNLKMSLLLGGDGVQLSFLCNGSPTITRAERIFALNWNPKRHFPGMSL